jgi:hypothetical protein
MVCVKRMNYYLFSYTAGSQHNTKGGTHEKKHELHLCQKLAHRQPPRKRN